MLLVRGIAAAYQGLALCQPVVEADASKVWEGGKRQWQERWLADKEVVEAIRLSSLSIEHKQDIHQHNSNTMKGNFGRLANQNAQLRKHIAQPRRRDTSDF